MKDDFNRIEVIIVENPIVKFIKMGRFEGIFKRFLKFQADKIIDYHEIPNNVRIHIVNSYFHIPINVIDKLKLFLFSDIMTKDILKYIKKENLNFDIIHTHFSYPYGYIGKLIKYKYKNKLIITVHGYDIYSLPFKDNEWKAKIEYVLNTADHVITVSQSNLAYIKKLNIFTPVSVIPNGFRSDLFFPRNTLECRGMLNLPLDKKIILTVGNLEPIKGQIFLVKAMKLIVRERKDVLCVIVGTGKLRTELENQIRSLGLEDHVILVGGKPHEEIPLWMNACDLFVLPSLNEGNPTVMFEALGCGKPFVGTKVGGIPEIINSDDYGLLVEPADPEDLAEKIMMALDREWDSEKILTYAEQFFWENIAKGVMGVYEQVLGRD